MADYSGYFIQMKAFGWIMWLWLTPDFGLARVTFNYVVHMSVDPKCLENWLLPFI